MAPKARRHHHEHSKSSFSGRQKASCSSQNPANYSAIQSIGNFGSFLTPEDKVMIELHSMFQKFQEDIRKKLFTERILKVKISTSFKKIQKKWDRMLKEQHKRRLNLYEEDTQEFARLFQSSKRQMNKLKKEGERLATLYKKQDVVFQQSLSVHSQKIEDWKKFCDQHLKENLEHPSDSGNVEKLRATANKTLEANANTSNTKESEDQNLDRSPASSYSSRDSLAWALT
ncbi:synaptonemal complex protein 3-like isoform 1-T2 [Thomomys bottae]